MGTQSRLTAPTDADYLARLSDHDLELIGTDRALRWNALIDSGEYEAAELAQVDVASIHREVERRMEIVAAQGRALRLFMESGPTVTTDDDAKDWGIAHDDFDRA